MNEHLDSLLTPCLLLERERMQRNIKRLKEHLGSLGTPLRPHVKTSKCMEVARLLMPQSSGPATASTLKEVEYLAAGGVRDILYAVGIAPPKLPRIFALRRAGTDVAVVLDSPEQAHAVVEACRQASAPIPVLIEIDSDGHRSVIRPGDPSLVAIGRILDSGGAELRGVMTHAGGSYDHAGADAHTAAAERERLAAVTCAEALRANGLPCPAVSVGSTPTALFASNLAGVTEVRAGVFVFFDLVMAGLGVCAIDDIALSVLATVIGHQRDRGWILVDAGWMAMSQDRGTSRQNLDQGYGMICDPQGRPYPGLIMAGANQEHGILAIRAGADARVPDLAVGAQVRILPNHACATAAQFDRYHILDDSQKVVDVWRRFSGWYCDAPG